MNVDKTSDASMLQAALSQLSGAGSADKGFEDAFHTAMGVETADELLEDALGIKDTAFSSSKLTGSTNPYAATKGTLLQTALTDKLTDEDAVRELLTSEEGLQELLISLCASIGGQAQSGKSNMAISLLGAAAALGQDQRNALLQGALSRGYDEETVKQAAAIVFDGAEWDE